MQADTLSPVTSLTSTRLRYQIRHALNLFRGGSEYTRHTAEDAGGNVLVLSKAGWKRLHDVNLCYHKRLTVRRSTELVFDLPSHDPVAFNCFGAMLSLQEHWASRLGPNDDATVAYHALSPELVFAFNVATLDCGDIYSKDHEHFSRDKRKAILLLEAMAHYIPAIVDRGIEPLPYSKDYLETFRPKPQHRLAG